MGRVASRTHGAAPTHTGSLPRARFPGGLQVCGTSGSAVADHRARREVRTAADFAEDPEACECRRTRETAPAQASAGRGTGRHRGRPRWLREVYGGPDDPQGDVPVVRNWTVISPCTTHLHDCGSDPPVGSCVGNLLLLATRDSNRYFIPAG